MAKQEDVAAVRRVSAELLSQARFQLAQNKALVEQSAVTVAHTMQLRTAQETALAFDSQIADFSERLFHLASCAADAVTTVNDVAGGASAYAASAATAMATSAGSIIAAAKAVDAYLHEIAGLAELVGNEAKNTELSVQAKSALQQARKIARSADVLRQQSLQANVLSATARAEAAQQSASDTAQKMQVLSDRAQQTFAAAATSRAAQLKAVATSGSQAASAIEGYVVNALACAGSSKQASTINAVANWNLTARQMTVDEGHTSANVPADWPALSGLTTLGPGIVATISAVAADQPGYYFFLVPSEQRYDMHLAKLKSLIHSAETANRFVLVQPTQDGPLSAALFYTFEGKALSGADNGYVVFAVRKTTGTYTDADISLASDTVVPTWSLPAPAVNAEDKPHGDAWVSVSATLPDSMPADLAARVQLRCYLVRWDVSHALGDLAGDIIARQPAIFAKTDPSEAQPVRPEKEAQETAPEGGKTRLFNFGEDDTDAFGDLLQPGGHYSPFVYAALAPLAQTHDDTSNAPPAIVKSLQSLPMANPAFVPASPAAGNGSPTQPTQLRVSPPKSIRLN